MFCHFNNKTILYITDPRCWLREDVQTWIRHLAAVHGLPAVQPDRFLMNGKALCLMTMEMFCQRVPLGGKMLYKDFQLRLSMALYGNSNSNQYYYSDNHKITLWVVGVRKLTFNTPIVTTTENVTSIMVKSRYLPRIEKQFS